MHQIKILLAWLLAAAFFLSAAPAAAQRMSISDAEIDQASRLLRRPDTPSTAFQVTMIAGTRLNLEIPAEMMLPGPHTATQ